MQVICTDGTVLQCDRFEAIDSGVLLFDQPRQREAGEEESEADEESDESEEAMAFVPLHQLRFVLPEGYQPGGTSGQQAARQTPPQGAPTPPQASPGAAPPGQMQSQQGFPGQPPQTRQGGGQSSFQQGSGQPR